MQKINNPPKIERTDYESVAARVQSPTCPKQLQRDIARLEYYDRFVSSVKIPKYWNLTIGNIKTAQRDRLPYCGRSWN